MSHMAYCQILTPYLLLILKCIEQQFEIDIALKLRSHRANGRVTDKKLFYPFVSVRIRSLSVSHPVTPFLVR